MVGENVSAGNLKSHLMKIRTYHFFFNISFLVPFPVHKSDVHGPHSSRFLVSVVHRDSMI